MDTLKGTLSQAAAILGRRAGVKRTDAQTAARRLNMAKAREYLLRKRRARVHIIDSTGALKPDSTTITTP